MASPIWQTQSNIGVFNTNQLLTTTLVAKPVLPSTQINYFLISGVLPLGTSLDNISGVISGIPENILNETVYNFTIRAVDNLQNLRDRTFSITMVGSNKPYFYTQPGLLLTTMDSVYVRFDLQYINNISTNNIFISLISGSLPPGLQLLPSGTIIGYPEQPLTITGSYAEQTYSFTLQLASELGNDTANYSITVYNQSLKNLPNTRKPAILNIRPLMFPVPLTDPYYEYYIEQGKPLPTINSGDFFAFKVIGHDFDNEQLTYNYVNLPAGLSGDTNTGWITGVMILPTLGKINYNFSVTVHKTVNPSLTSDILDLSIIVVNSLTPDITWISNSNLGNISNGTISEFAIQAQSSETLRYEIVDGSLPPNLSLLLTGEIVGRVPQQASTTYMNLNDSITYTFTVSAYSPTYHLINDTKDFSITVVQSFDYPFENVYIKAYPDMTGRSILYSLLNDETLIPKTALYRPTDPYFGKATEVKCVHAYGMLVADAQAYTLAMQQNHYVRKFILGDLKLAVARDSSFNVVYEVVYCELIDNLSINQDISLPQTIIWPTDINLRNNASLINNTQLPISNNTTLVSETTTSVRELNPSSLINMRSQITSTIGRYLDSSVLPTWMTSQQLNAEPLGFLESWVLCYALPGQGQTIIDNINSNWPYKLNQIDFTVDRYIIDKSLSYNFNTNFTHPFWSKLPSATPAPNPLNSDDLPVLFPRKTILPTGNQN